MMNKSSNMDILVYTVVIVAIMLLYKMEIVGYTAMSVLLVIALAGFAAYNFRNSIKKLFRK